MTVTPGEVHAAQPLGAHVTATSAGGAAHRAARGEDRLTPPERWDPSVAWSLTDLGSACTVGSLDAASRRDPFWDSLWLTGSSGSWKTPGTARKHRDLGLARLPASLDMDADTALASFLKPDGWESRLALLGAVHGWRNLSCEQAAALVGDPHIANATRRHVATAFASGLVDLGVYAGDFTKVRLEQRGALLRPSKSPDFDRHVLPRLTYAEWASVTGGGSWTGTGVYDRHNLLTTELGLRFAEYTDVGTVLGERFSTMDHLAGTGVGRPAIVGSQRSADLTVVRPDGMRVAFEITAGISPGFRAKVREWVRVLFEQPIESSGLCVVFLLVGSPDDVDAPSMAARSEIHNAVLAALKEFPGSSYNPIAERIGVATWREWFPGKGLCTDDFFAMRVLTPSGVGAERWQPRDLLDETADGSTPDALGRPFTPVDGFDPTVVLGQAALLGQTPYWMRSKYQRPDLWRTVAAARGVNAPHPTPVRANRVKGRPLGAGVGAAGDARPPRRLLGLG